MRQWRRRTRDTRSPRCLPSGVCPAVDYGSILHYDGSTWASQACSYCTAGTGAWELDGVWGSSESDVFAVGQGGDIVHYDGTTCTVQAGGAADFLWSVWGRSPGGASEKVRVKH